MKAAGLIARLRDRVMLAISRARVALVDDSGLLQRLQLAVLRDEIRDGVERLAEYGFTSRPFPGASAVMVCVGGNRDHGVVIATGDRRYRLKELAEGEVALYDDQGQVVHLLRNGELLVKALTKARVEAPTIEATATVLAKVTAPAIQADALTAPGTVAVSASASITLTAPQIYLSGQITGGPSGGSLISVGATQAKLQAASGNAVEANAANARILAPEIRLVETT